MKRSYLINSRLLFIFMMMVTALSSCLKDKGFKDGEYGMPSTEGQAFISIPKAINKPNVLGLESKAGMQDVKLFAASYDFVNPTSSDITVTLEANNQLVTDLNDPTVVILPTAVYSIPSLTLTIPAGQRLSDELLIKLNTSTLDPTKKFGLGFSIKSVSNNANIPSNLKNIVYAFTIKNKFDGIYSFRSQMLHPSDRSADWTRAPWGYPYDIHLITTGPNSVKLFNTAFGAGFHPLVTTGVSGFGSTEPNFVFDDNNKLVDVFNGVSGSRSFKLNPAVSTSRYDPATKTLYAAILMSQTGFQDIPIYDTLVFTKARP